MNVDPVAQKGAELADGKGAGDPVLRAKYIDFCSAHLTEIFLTLSDERIYELVEETASDADLHMGSLGFTSMVRLLTRRLQEDIPLPDFETWSREYTADPEKYEPYLLGLWEEILSAAEDPSR